MSSPVSDEIRVESPDIVFAFPGTLRRVRNAILALFALSFVALFESEKIAWFFRTTDDIVTNTIVSVMGVEMLALFIASFFAEPRKPVAGHIRAGRDGIEITHAGRSVRIAREELDRGSYATEPVRLEFVRRGGDLVRVGVRSTGEASSLLRAAGFDVSQRVLEFATGNLADTVIRGAAFAVLSAFVAGGIAVGLFDRLGDAAMGKVFLATWITSMVVGMIATARPRIAIGADGIRVQRPFRSEFFPFSDVRVSWVAAGMLRVARADGRERRLDLHGLAPSDRMTLSERITQAQRSQRALRSEPTAAPQIERKGRSVAEWTRELIQLAKGSIAYRASSLATEELLRIVVDPSANAERRIGAAITVRARGDEKAVERVRVAIDACASEPVKRALHHAVEGTLDDADVEAAIEAELRSLGTRAT